MTKMTYDYFECPVCETRFLLSIAPDGITHTNTKPHSEVSKLKLFIEVFNALSGKDRLDVNQNAFHSELLLTGKFSGDEIDAYLKKAIQNGQIYDRKEGMLAKA